jgi:nudix-type nucleoside diphosphatase (YffH/AdpP family)
VTAFPQGIVVTKVETLAQDWNLLRRYSLRCRGRDGSISLQRREVLHRPDTASVLPYSGSRRSVFLISQVRAPVVLAGFDGVFLEAPGGIIDQGEDPVQAAAREVREETGFDLSDLRSVGSYFLNPALSTERSHLFLADVDDGGRDEEFPPPEDTLGALELIEIPFASAIRMCRDGAVTDAKTALLVLALANSGRI